MPIVERVASSIVRSGRERVVTGRGPGQVAPVRVAGLPVDEGCWREVHPPGPGPDAAGMGQEGRHRGFAFAPQGTV